MYSITHLTTFENIQMFVTTNQFREHSDVCYLRPNRVGNAVSRTDGVLRGDPRFEAIVGLKRELGASVVL